MKKRIAVLIAGVMAAVLILPAFAAGEGGGEENEAVRLPVVMYHHVSKRASAWNDYVISPQELESDLRWLRDNGWESISVKNLLDWYDGTFEMPAKPFMITFDDGFESTVAYAEPLLAEYGFCGAVAVIGSVCEKFTECGEHYPEVSNMSWEDAAEAARRGVLEVQCHTWDMHGLGSRTGCDRMRWEDAQSYRAKLEDDLSRFLEESRAHGLELTMSIAYPYGAFCGDTTDIVKELGFQAAFTCNEEINLLTGDREELFSLGRYNRPHGRSSQAFFSRWETG